MGHILYTKVLLSDPLGDMKSIKFWISVPVDAAMRIHCDMTTNFLNKTSKSSVKQDVS